jgi:hypothetical protein
MLQLAFKHRESLQNKWMDWSLTDDSKFYSLGTYRDYKLEIEDSNWSKLQFVSVNKKGEILGYFGASFSIDRFKFDNIFVILFETNLLSHRDLYRFFSNIYNDPRANKIEWSVVIGNVRAEKLYQHIIEKYNGNIVGINKSTVRLSDGKFYDMKYYELFTNSMNKIL